MRPDYGAVLGLVDLRRWGKRAGLFSMLARLSIDAPELGAYVGQRDAAAAVCCDRGYAWNLLRWMTQERVFDIAQPGAGRRPTRYRINPNMRAWLGVPWLVTPEHAAYVVLGGGRRSQAQVQPFVTRSHSASQRDRVTRSHGASQTDENGPIEELCDAIYGASQANSCDAPWDRVTKNSSPRADTYMSERSKDLSLLGRGERADVQQAIDAIQARTGYPVHGRLVDEVALLIDDVGSVDIVLAAIPDVDPHGMKSPMFVAALSRQLQAGQTTRLDVLQRQIKSLDEVIAAARAAGIEPEAQLAERAAINLQLERSLRRPGRKGDGLG